MSFLIHINDSRFTLCTHKNVCHVTLVCSRILNILKVVFSKLIAKINAVFKYVLSHSSLSVKHSELTLTDFRNVAQLGPAASLNAASIYE